MATRSKLAVILHADVVGSTTLVQMDERVAHERIRDAFQHCAGIIARYGGEVHELRGDALLAEFQRPSDAVTAALATQGDNAERNNDLTDDIRPVIRIGIALGEVVIADNTITGPGVVMAQRLEQLAEPGGVCLQSSVHESVPKRFPFDYENLGKQSLKGFDEPVWAFSATLHAGDVLPAPEHKLAPESKIRRPRRQWLAVVTVALLFVAGGLIAWWQPWITREEPESNERMSAPLSDKPSIAVLAFTNMSGDPDQDFFAEGIAEDIVTDLSKLSGVFVTAGYSSFAYKSKTLPVSTIAHELGVRYLLEGSVRRAGRTLRVNAQLIDARSGAQVWAERYDGLTTDVFALQDKVTADTVGALSVTLTQREQAILRKEETKNLEAYDAVLRGIRHLNAVHQWNQEENFQARQQFMRAVELDDTYARAYAGLGYTYYLDYELFSGSYNDFEQAQKLAASSIKLADNALARQIRAKEYLVFGWLPHNSRQHDSAVTELRRAIELEPHNANALAELAYALVYAGEPSEATTLMREAIRLNPNFPSWYHQPIGIAHFLLEDYGRAAASFTSWLEADELAGRPAIWLAAAQVQNGQLEDGKRTLAAIMTRPSPGGGLGERLTLAGINLQALKFRFPFKKDTDIERLLEGLRRAGVPETPQ